MTDSKEAKQTRPTDQAIPQALLDHVIATYKKPSDLIGMVLWATAAAMFATVIRPRQAATRLPGDELPRR